MTALEVAYAVFYLVFIVVVGMGLNRILGGDNDD